MLFVWLIVIPLVGVLWFLNVVFLLKKLHEHRDPHNQIVLGAVWTFLFIFSVRLFLLDK
ncbi:hypothetical protein GGR02_002028 [Anoxybacillus voinovskiensis]|uniref:Uncharacterized protein n=1 Tax=Anoxybacteroides voinovskiense TaxID=230470 RepID=A0A840DRH5_9BACL|nr:MULTISPECIES: hypothetical protein [Anoxybacillus]MBB4074263.1 hypothetical protein [Anoxybacillus voinovskiensis]MCL6587736.1 hypothetical protein [Anoxybacillus sp.]GGJ69051.1 hypothetical protein GCM10008982_18130 [Anoxybacillus voinovskiensis]